MNWREIPCGVVHAMEQRLLHAISDDADLVAKQINADPSFAEKAAKLIVALAKNNITSPERAREIMCENFFGVKEAVKCFRVTPTQAQLTVLSVVPFSEQDLDKCKETHILIAVFPISVLEVEEKVGHHVFWKDKEYENIREHDALKECGEVGWRLVSKTEVVDSIAKDWVAQKALLDESNVVPTLQLMVYTVVGYYLISGVQLFPEVYVRTASLHCIGLFDANGLSIGSSGTGAHDSVGIAKARF